VLFENKLCDKIEDLERLLTTPAEALNVEYKTWLDLKGNDEHKANLAKDAIAIANEGGGYIVIGLREERPNLISEPCPPEIAAYDQDTINQIVRRFALPSFHCRLTTLRHPDTRHEHCVIGVPGGFGFPVMSKSGTPQNTIRPHLCYIRKAGPESAPPENQADWERLLSRCLRNRREDMLDAIRAIVHGEVGSAVAALEQDSCRASICLCRGLASTLGSSYGQSRFKCTRAMSAWPLRIELRAIRRL
jgi:hypothetical protein